MLFLIDFSVVKHKHLGKTRIKPSGEMSLFE